PWRVPPIDPAWLRWGNGTVPAMARAIYDDEAWEQSPILADALEEAGCEDGPMLRHLREPGEHVRGCWAIDLLVQRGV
ncbi:MAG: hypothetical protein K2W96_03220, partial [Gemmataceae bacterium]|nr:hypothetical protein [Gemmataceae bacterium]